MNLLKCKVDHAGYALQFEGAATLPFGAIRGAAALDKVNEVTLGIRPEHIALCADPKDGCLPARLYIVQELGSEILVVFRVNQQLITVRRYSDQLPALPEQVWLELQQEHIFLYDEHGDLIS